MPVVSDPHVSPVRLGCPPSFRVQEFSAQTELAVSPHLHRVVSRPSCLISAQASPLHQSASGTAKLGEDKETGKGELVGTE